MDLMAKILAPDLVQKPRHDISNLPRISIVIPSYNSSDFIEKSLLSVVNQGYPNYQIIVVDGCSSDDTSRILSNYSNYIDHCITEPDSGQSEALNKGFKFADGDIFCWLNADDLFMPDAFFSISRKFTENKNARIIFGDWITIDPDDYFIKYFYAFDFSLNHFAYEGFTMNSQACFWKAEVHKRFGQFSEDLHRTMDYEMLLRFGINEGNNAFVRIPEPLACFRQHDNQKTGSSNKVMLEEHTKIAMRTGYSRKLTWQSIPLQLIYRARRALWYMKRGGIAYTLAQMAHARLMPIVTKSKLKS